MDFVMGGGAQVGIVVARSQGAAVSTLPAWATAGGAPTPIFCYQPKGALSLADSYKNLANPGAYDAAPGTAPTLVANGWEMTGTQYLTSGVAPGANWSAIVKFSNASGKTTHHLIGMYNATGGITLFHIRPRISDASRGYGYGTNVVTVSGALTSGVIGLAANQGYLNGSTDGSAITTGAWIAGINLYIGARNENGTAANFYRGTIEAVAAWNSNISAYMAAVSAALALI